jgi:hypothetical protein
MPDQPEPPEEPAGDAAGWGADLEREVPGARYGLVLFLLLATFVFMAAGPTGSWVPLVTAILQGATLLAALAASEARARVVKFAIVVVALALAGGVAALVEDASSTNGYTSVLSFVLIAVAPVAIVQSMWRRRVIDVHTVLGAICIYVFVGMFFSFLFSAVGDFGTHPFFVQQKTATLADYLYFSFVTLTTTGYGDLTASGGFGRAASVLEALSGQLYLVTVLALLVSQLGSRRRRG